MLKATLLNVLLISIPLTLIGMGIPAYLLHKTLLDLEEKYNPDKK